MGILAIAAAFGLAACANGGGNSAQSWGGGLSFQKAIRKASGSLFHTGLIMKVSLPETESTQKEWDDALLESNFLSYTIENTEIRGDSVLQVEVDGLTSKTTRGKGQITILAGEDEKFYL